MRKLRQLLLPADSAAPPDAQAAGVPRRSAAAVDVLIALALACVTIVMAFRGGSDLNPEICEWEACDVYFDADTPRVLLDMTGRFNDHYRTRIHPLFPLVAIPPEKVFEKILGMDAIAASRAVIAGVAGLWAAGLFTLLRVIGSRRLDAMIFTTLGLVSGAAMFWFIVPDTYPFGSLSILAALLVVAINRRRPEWPVNPIIAVAVSAFTLSITITNFMAGLVMAVCGYPLRKAVGISLAAVALVLALWCVEKAMMPSVQFPLSNSSEEARYMLEDRAGGAVRIAAAFFLHTMVVPEPTTCILNFPGQWTHALSVQKVNPGAGSVMGMVAVTAWALLLVIGALALLTGACDRWFGLMLAAVLAGQFGLHLLYGSETFVYSMHFAPLLVTLAALGARTRLRPLALALALAAAAFGAAHNRQSLRLAKDFLNAPHTIMPDPGMATADAVHR